MNAIVLRILHTAVIDSASRYNNDIRIFPDIKIIIDSLFDSALAQNDRNMNIGRLITDRLITGRLLPALFPFALIL